VNFSYTDHYFKTNHGKKIMTAYRIVYTTLDGTIRECRGSDGGPMTFDSSTDAQNVIDNTPDIPRNAQVEVCHTSQNDDNEEERARAEQEERERERQEAEKAIEEQRAEKERFEEELRLAKEIEQEFEWEWGG
jgi:hypothetical protein